MEHSEQWEAIRQMLFDQWQKDKSNFEVLIRLASECWLVLTEWDCCINNENLVFEKFKNNLIDTCIYGLKHFETKTEFLCVFGYMISLFPYFFYYGESDGRYSLWEKRGKEMLERAHQNAPNDLLTKVLFLGSTDREREYRTEKSKLEFLLSELFPGDSAIEQYFKDVLTN